MVREIKNNPDLYVNRLTANAAIRAVADETVFGTIDGVFKRTVVKVNTSSSQISPSLYFAEGDYDGNTVKASLEKVDGTSFVLNVTCEREPELGTYLTVYDFSNNFKMGEYIGVSENGQIFESGLIHREMVTNYSNYGRFWIPGSGTYTFTHVDALQPEPDEKVEISEENFPDAIFRQYIADSFDTDQDGVLSSVEISNITNVSLSAQAGIASLKGIEFLSELQVLDCRNTSISELDVSQNSNLQSLKCDSVSISELDVTQNSSLQHLSCIDTPICELDLSQNVGLKYLACSQTQITQLQLQNNNDLQSLNHSGFAVAMEGEYPDWYGMLPGQEPVYKTNDSTFSLKENAPILQLDRVKDVVVSDGATWNQETGEIENISADGAKVKYTYVTGGTYNGEPIEISVSFTVQKEDSTTPTPAPTTQPTATPAPTAKPTATPAPIPGTPGQVTEDKAEQLAQNPANKELANEIVTGINDNKAISVSKNTVTAVVNSIQYSPVSVGAVKDGIQFTGTIHSDNTGMKLVPEGASINGNRAQISLHFVSENGTSAQPKLGALVSVKIPNKTMPAGDYVLVGEGNQLIDSATVTVVGNDTLLTFWAPHFSTYIIIPRSEYVPNSTPDTNSGNNTPNTPIKGTGFDMNMALMSSVALAGVVVVAGVVTAKKREQ